MRELFWLSDKELNALWLAVKASPTRTKKLVAKIEREIKERE